MTSSPSSTATLEEMKVSVLLGVIIEEDQLLFDNVQLFHILI